MFHGLFNNWGFGKTSPQATVHINKANPPAQEKKSAEPSGSIDSLSKGISKVKITPVVKRKIACTRCNKLFNFETLAKRNGICGRCASSALAIPKKTKALRASVWDTWLHPYLKIGPCYVCLKEINYDNYEMAHVVSDRDGGKMEVSNLRPTCSSCNKGCGTMNLDEFKKQFKGAKGDVGVINAKIKSMNPYANA